MSAPKRCSFTAHWLAWPPLKAPAGDIQMPAVTLSKNFTASAVIQLCQTCKSWSLPALSSQDAPIPARGKRASLSSPQNFIHPSAGTDRKRGIQACPNPLQSFNSTPDKLGKDWLGARSLPLESLPLAFTPFQLRYEVLPLAAAI